MLSKISAVFERSTISLTLSDMDQPDSPLIMVNEAFCALFGYSREEILGRNCRFLQGVETTNEQRALFRAAIENFTDARGLITNYTKAGGVFVNYLFVFPVQEIISGRRLMLGSQFNLSVKLNLHTPLEHVNDLSLVLAKFRKNEPAWIFMQNLELIATSMNALVASHVTAAAAERLVQHSLL